MVYCIPITYSLFYVITYFNVLFMFKPFKHKYNYLYTKLQVILLIAIILLISIVINYNLFIIYFIYLSSY